MRIKSITTKRPKALTGGTGMIKGTYRCGGHLKACGGKMGKKSSKKSR